MVFQVTEFKNVIDFLFVWWRDVMTSCHDVTTLDLPISACRCAWKLILFCFHGFSGHWVQNCYWFFICVMTWRHDVMSWRHKTWFTISQLVDELESWFFFCFHGFSGHWVQKFGWFSILSMFLRHDVTSWRHVNTYHHPTAHTDLVVKP